MAHVRRYERGFRDPTNGEDVSTRCELMYERQAGFNLGPCRRAIGARRAGVGRHDIPEQNIVLELELGEHAVDDRRCRLGGAGAGQLTLGREWDPETRAPR
jgi:hypothetical protein